MQIDPTSCGQMGHMVTPINKPVTENNNKYNRQAVSLKRNKNNFCIGTNGKIKNTLVRTTQKCGRVKRKAAKRNIARKPRGEYSWTRPKPTLDIFQYTIVTKDTVYHLTGALETICSEIFLGFTVDFWMFYWRFCGFGEIFADMDLSSLAISVKLGLSDGSEDQHLSISDLQSGSQVSGSGGLSVLLTIPPEINLCKYPSVSRWNQQKIITWIQLQSPKISREKWALTKLLVQPRSKRYKI